MIGLSLGLEGFVSAAEEQGTIPKVDLLDSLGTLAVEVGSRYGLRPATTPGIEVLLIGETKEAVLQTVYAFADTLEPESGYLPIHVKTQRGRNVVLDDGETLTLEFQVIATAHPADLRPATRV